MAKKGSNKNKKATPKQFLKKGFAWYPLKKETVIGDKLRPIGFKIGLNVDGYKFYKRLNII